MRKFLRLLASVKVAVILIAYLAISGMAATLIPQGQAPEYYHARYPGILSDIVIRSGYSDFFSSGVFLFPAALFFINLTACTVGRLAKELKKNHGKRFGPVLLHFGLMVLLFGSVMSFATRKDGLVFLAKGERVELPAGRSLILLDFTFEQYTDGRPKDWTSRVQVTKDGTIEVESFSLRVNAPLEIGGLKLYQASYGSEWTLRIKDASGAEHFLNQGADLQFGPENARLMSFDPEDGKALFRIMDAAGPRLARAGPGDSVGSFAVTGIETRDTSGIQAVRDYGYPVVVAALVLIGIGVFLTFFRKLGDIEQ